MSDCSTNAFKAKAMDLHECSDCEHYCSECGTCCKSVPDHQDCMFRCWKPSRAHAIEQRYERLAQVAREMWELVKVFELSSFGSVDLSELREQIEALGVSVDGDTND